MVWKLFDSAIPVAMLLIYAGVPIMALWGCIRWYKEEHPRTLVAWLSCAGFWLGVASGIMAVASIAYGQLTNGRAYYAPSFPRVIYGGFLLSAIAVLLALAGLWRRSPLRWHAAVCSLAMLFYWSTAIFE
jgi:hypothetical protein